MKKDYDSTRIYRNTHKKRVRHRLMTHPLLFGLWMIYAISGEWKWLSNKVVKYLSGISMEIYLSHMVLFRLTEKMGLDQITGNSDLNYIMATVVTLAMTIGFCHVVKYKFLPKVMGCIKNKKINENSIC